MINKYKQMELCKQENWKLSASISNTMKLRLQLKQSFNNLQCYEVQLKSMKESSKISEFFETFEDLATHLKDRKNIVIKKGKINTILMEIVQHKKLIEIGLIRLYLVQNKNYPTYSQNQKQLLSFIYQKCNAQTNLSSSDVKIMFKNIIILLESFTLNKQYFKNKYKNDQQIRQINRKIYKFDDNYISKQQFKKFKQQILKEDQINFQEITKIKQNLNYQIQIRKKINKQYQQIYNKIQEKFNKYSQEINKLYEQLSNIKYENKQIISQQSLQLKGRKNKLENIQTIIVTNKENLFENLGQNQKQLTMESKQNRNKITQELSANEQQQVQQKQQEEKLKNDPVTSQIMAKNWLDNEANDYSTLKFVANCIKSVKFNTKAYGQRKISEKNTFTIQLISCQKYMSIGLIDQKYKKKKNTSGLQNKIEYYNDKAFWNGKQDKDNQGKGFKQGQSVTVVVNSKQGTILWKVGQQIRFSATCQKLKDPNIEWIPYIYVRCKSDIIKIVN